MSVSISANVCSCVVCGRDGDTTTTESFSRRIASIPSPQSLVVYPEGGEEEEEEEDGSRGVTVNGDGTGGDNKGNWNETRDTGRGGKGGRGSRSRAMKAQINAMLL